MLDSWPTGKRGVNHCEQHGTDDRSIDVADTSEKYHQEYEDRQVKGDEVGIDVLVLLRHQRSGDATGDGRHHEGHHLGAVHANSNRGRGDLIGLEGQQSPANPPADEVTYQQMREQRNSQSQPDPLQHSERHSAPGQGPDAEQAAGAAENISPFAHYLFHHDAKGECHHRQVRTLCAQRWQRNQDAACTRDHRC